MLQNKEISKLPAYSDDRNEVLPREIILDEIAPYLSCKTAVSLTLTCKFFAKNQDLKRILATKISISAGQHFTIFLHKGSLYQIGYRKDHINGSNPQEQLPILEVRTIALPNGKEAKHVATSGYHTFIQCEDGSLYTFGRNCRGQLGLGYNYFGLNYQSTPKLLTLPNGKRAKQVVASNRNSFILCEDGSLYGFGSNTCGQLGLGHTRDQFTPKLLILPDSKKAKQVAISSAFHTFILCEDGSLYSFGSNLYGQLGLGDRNDRYTPQLLILPDSKEAKQVVTGQNRTFILCEDGSLYGFGCNLYGQLGLGDTNHRSTPQLITLPDGKKAEQMVTGNYYNIVLCEDGSLYSFGFNLYGQLGLGDTNHRYTPQLITLPDGKKAKQAISGSYHIFLLTEDGLLYGWGDKYLLGDGIGLEHKVVKRACYFTPTALEVLKKLSVESEMSVLKEESLTYAPNRYRCSLL
jgi:alpha-tubulin suppressor-like RCC1 family protein